MPNDAGRITLVRTGRVWCAKFSGEAAESIRHAFGTDTIPTAYGIEAPAKQVQRDIRYMWPKCIVSVEEG